MNFPKFRKKELSLNHAKMKPEEVQNLRLREGIIHNKNMEIQRLQTELMMLGDSDRMYKQQLMDQYGLRKKKKYVFNTQQGYIHRPNLTPWKLPKDETMTNGKIKDPDKVLENAKDILVKQVREDQETHTQKPADEQDSGPVESQVKEKA